MHNVKTYAVIEIVDLELIDFSQIEEDSKDTIRKSLDDTARWLYSYFHNRCFGYSSRNL
jgi:hypothetical protein